MNQPAPQPSPVIGCVNFLNARPLIDGLDDAPDLAIHYDVPSNLLDALLTGKVDIALCPVIDYQLSPVPLDIVPVGCIGSSGPTHTVRLFSREPFEHLRTIYADTDSHTSVALLRIVLAETLNLHPRIQPFDSAHTTPDNPAAMLLIGDKVVHSRPPRDDYPYQLDLGRAWKTLTDLPFVFAVWMARPDSHLAAAPRQLNHRRLINRNRLNDIVQLAAAQHGWPPDLAHTYLAQVMQYDVGPPQLQAMELFWRRAHEHRLFPRLRPLSLVAAPTPTPPAAAQPTPVP